MPVEIAPRLFRIAWKFPKKSLPYFRDALYLQEWGNENNSNIIIPTSGDQIQIQNIVYSNNSLFE